MAQHTPFVTEFFRFFIIIWTGTEGKRRNGRPFDRHKHEKFILLLASVAISLPPYRSLIRNGRGNHFVISISPFAVPTGNAGKETLNAEKKVSVFIFQFFRVQVFG